jgi:ABC-type uncharacterized transport system substrate-binding protein
LNNKIATAAHSESDWPSGNVTGFTNFEPAMGGKWVEVLKDVDPGVRRIAILFNPETATGGGQVFLPPFEASATALDVEPIEANHSIRSEPSIAAYLRV